MTAAPLRAVFMGTPGFAARILERVLASDRIKVTAVYTQPDRPAGRGKALKAPEVKILAQERGLPVFQPLHFKRQADVDALAAQAPDVLLVAAYGLILPQRVLDIPRLMPVNVHASLLPRHRGAAPIQRAIMEGDAETGVSIMRMEAGLDTGPVLARKALPILPDDTSATLHDKLAVLGAESLLDVLGMLTAGTAKPEPQDDSLATHAAKLTKADGELDFAMPGRLLHARIRGVTPWPGGCFTLLRPGQEPLVVQAQPGKYVSTEEWREKCAGKGPLPPPGSILGLCGPMLLVACADGVYGFPALRPAAGKLMDAKAFHNGYLRGAGAACRAARGPDA